MASQIYSRYVPPPRKKDGGNQEPRVESPAQNPATIPTQPTPPATRSDASSTYARYIPPSKTRPATSEPLSSVFEKESSVGVERNSENTETLPEHPLKISKKSKKNSSTTNEPIEAQDENAEQPRKPKRKAKAGAVDQDSKDYINQTEAQILQFKIKEFNEFEASEDIGESEPRKSSKRSKSKDVAFNLASAEGVTDEEDAKHQRLMRKREKSLRKAEKFAEIIPESKDDDGDHIMTEPGELHDLVPLPQPEPVPELPPISTVDSLPSWLASPIRVTQTSTSEFGELGLQEEVVKTLKARGFAKAFAVQAAVLPLLLPEANRQTGDVVVSAATGSGKTLAYVLPIVKDISRFQVSKLRGLIVMPTRELVAQAKEVTEMCASAFSMDQKRIKIGTAVGSDTLKAEQASLILHEYIYDPDAYEESLRDANRKWVATEDIDDGIEALLEDKPISKLPGHVERLSMKINVLICTPGRLVEHIKSTPGFTLQDISWLVVDEADKLLDQSYQQWLGLVLAGIEAKKKLSLPKDNHFRKVILSATMTRDLGQLNELKLYRPRLVVLEAAAEDSRIVEQKYVLPSLLLESAMKVEEDGIKPLYLIELLRRQNIIPKEVEAPKNSDDDLSDSESDSDSSDSDSSEDSSATKSLTKSPLELLSPLDLRDPRGVLIFTRSNEAAVRLGRLVALLAPALSSAIGVLTSTLPRSSRQRTLQSFMKGKVLILVASDLVSRGLDLPNLAHVVNYDVPSSLTSYIHRIGRTARANKKGHAWTLFIGTEGRWFWNEIGRSKHVQRPGGKIERVNIKAESFGEQERAIYEKALEELGKEATGAAS